MILFWHKLKEGEKSRDLLERALVAYCEAAGKRKPRKRNRAVSEGEHGKPYYPALPSVFVSVSHSGGYWTALFDRRPCGVDIELATRSRVSEAVIRRKFTPAEQALFDGAPGDETTFLRVWTRKEAFLKYTGEGLSRDLLSFSVAGEDGAGRPCFRGEAEPFYGEPRVILEEIDFASVPDAGGAPLPLIGALCGTPGDLRILPLPEPSAEDALEEAKEYALGWLETRMRTEREIRDKLREKNVSPEAADGAVRFLAEYGFLDDRAFAERYAAESVRKNKGPLRIEQELVRKGIGRDTAREAIRPYRDGQDGRTDGGAFETADDPPTFRETAEALARKAYEAAGSPPELDEKLAAKILRRLASRGFSASDSYAALDALPARRRPNR
jgi:SOS response regulatory protein OraA/RecX/phosphopantetheinyl transferase (holo-ACP synthase)